MKKILDKIMDCKTVGDLKTHLKVAVSIVDSDDSYIKDRQRWLLELEREVSSSKASIMHTKSEAARYITELINRIKT